MLLLVKKHGEVISREVRDSISMRYHTVTRAVNQSFWHSDSDIQNSLYVGSFGRGTAIDVSDIDILVELPKSDYYRYDVLRGNGQSRLLQAVREAILAIYPRSDIQADGQVVKISFNDSMRFEILPAFRNLNWAGDWDGTYKYPDANLGGIWRSTNPKAEQNAMQHKNTTSNGLLFDTCKHIRSVRNNYYNSYHLSGIVIDSFVYAAMGSWKWVNSGESSSASQGDYERVLLDYLNRNKHWLSLTSPGSGQQLDTRDSIECLSKVLDLIAE